MRVFSAFIVLLFAFLAATAGVRPVQAQEEIKPAGRRIVGGEKTEIKEHPWQVALNIELAGTAYLCGGAIIADRWVLTAAHCFKRSTKPGEVRAKAGATNYLTSGFWSDVDRIVIHEGYDPKTHENDIGLIRLRASPPGKVIPLATAEQNLNPGLPLHVTGWGATAEDGNASHLLMKAVVHYVENATCNAPEAYNGAIKDGMLCAGSQEVGIDACQGDSGGPLVLRSRKGPLLVGIVSWGEGCARKLKYGVYSRVAHYADWIANVIARTN